MFKEKYPIESNPKHKVGFNKFSELRPKECILAGASGTHTVCVCMIHQNQKLSFMAIKCDRMKSELNIKEESDFLFHMQCNPPSVSCCLGECDNCGDISDIKAHVESILEDECIDELKYKKWLTVDRAQLETILKPVPDFLDEFFDNLKVYQRHHFLTKMQSAYFQETKVNVDEDTVVVVSVCSENCTFLAQDEPQAYYFNKPSVTLHTTICYHIKNGVPLHFNYVAVSENNNHDTVSVHLYLRKLLDHAKEKIPGLKKVIYWSDGCAGQYKNCKVI